MPLNDIKLSTFVKFLFETMFLVTYINTQEGAPEFQANQKQYIHENLQFYEKNQKILKPAAVVITKTAFTEKFKKLCNSLCFFNARCSSESQIFLLCSVQIYFLSFPLTVMFIQTYSPSPSCLFFVSSVTSFSLW